MNSKQELKMLVQIWLILMAIALPVSMVFLFGWVGLFLTAIIYASIITGASIIYLLLYG